MPVIISETEVSLVSQLGIRLNGTAVEEAVMAKLDRAVVDQNVYLPGMFTLRFHDPGLELINHGPFNLTQEIIISAETGSGDAVTLIKGEITALEPTFQEGMIAELTVRGFDRSHRLFRETHTRAYLNIKDSDLAANIASAASLDSEVTPTATIYDHLFQHNQTDLAFLTERAWRIGYECFLEDGKLNFRRPPTSGGSLELTWGGDLLSFLPRVSLAEQVDEVVVRGWDVQQQQAIVGRSQNGLLYPETGEQRNGASWAHQFGSGRLVIVDQLVQSQAEADALAGARMNDISGAFIQADGVAFRRPDVQAGRIVDLHALGERFSGKYLVTSATHTYTPSGLHTNFSVRGLRSNLLSETIAPQDPVQRWNGVVIGIVTNNDDPQTQGRVKLKFPWMSEEAESDWARVLGLGAGNNRGLCILPAVGDEVLVAFEQGMFNRPYVLGGLWNGQSSPPAEVSGAPQNQKDQVSTWDSAKAHHISMYDTADNKIEIVTADGRSITLSDADRKISIHTQSADIILEDNKLTIKTSAEISMEAGTNLSLKANGNVGIQAGGQVNIKGSVINLNS